MRAVQLGDRVRVHCSRQSDDGVPSRKKTCNFVAGGDRVLRGLSLGVVGMTLGDQKQLILTAGEAYGAERPDLIRRVARNKIPSGIRLEVGRRLAAVHRVTGRRRLVQIMEVEGDSVLLNGNHPLAGREVRLEVRVVEVRAGRGGAENPNQQDADQA